MTCIHNAQFTGILPMHTLRRLGCIKAHKMQQWFMSMMFSADVEQNKKTSPEEADECLCSASSWAALGSFRLQLRTRCDTAQQSPSAGHRPCGSDKASSHASSAMQTFALHLVITVLSAVGIVLKKWNNVRYVIKQKFPSMYSEYQKGEKPRNSCV